MIVFDLECACGCQFEGWFESRDDFDRQHGADLITCPACGGPRIRKILSPVAIHAGPAHAVSSSQAPDEEKVSQESAISFLRAIQEVVEKNFEDVGTRLAEESLKINFGVSQPRNIRGYATADEEKMLQGEGIELIKVPMLQKKPKSKPQ